MKRLTFIIRVWEIPWPRNRHDTCNTIIQNNWWLEQDFMNIQNPNFKILVKYERTAKQTKVISFRVHVYWSRLFAMLSLII